MDLPSSLPEQPEQPLHSTEETLLQPSSATSEIQAEETVPQPQLEIQAEKTVPQPQLEIQAEETVPQPQLDPLAEEIPTYPASPSEAPTEEIVPLPNSPFAVNEGEALDVEDVDDDEEDEDEPPKLPGVFISRGILIAAGCAVVILALLATLVVVVNRPKDPPTDWIASYTPTATTTSTGGKILYYLHWTNQNGALQGQLQLATFSNGTLQSATAATVGLYSKDNHIIYVVVTLNGQASTLTGNINDASDTLTLNAPGATAPGSGLVFHKGSADDYKQATKKLGAAK